MNKFIFFKLEAASLGDAEEEEGEAGEEDFLPPETVFVASFLAFLFAFLEEVLVVDIFCS